MALATRVVSWIGPGTVGQSAQGALSSRSRIHSRRSGCALAVRAHQPGSVSGWSSLHLIARKAPSTTRLRPVFCRPSVSSKNSLEEFGKVRRGILREAMHDFRDQADGL